MVGNSGDIPKAPPGHIVVRRIKVTTRKKRATKTRTRVAKKSTKSSSDRTSFLISTPTGNAPTASIGLPSFRISDSNRKNGSIVSSEVADESFCPQESEDDIPSDTLMAIHSLIQSNQGLHVPITNNGSVQVVLESQVYSIFDQNHASTVNAELQKLIDANKVKRMCCHDMSTMALMLTEDYVKAVWDSHNNNDDEGSSTLDKAGCEEVVAWFLAQLHHWTNYSISESSIEDRWEGSQTKDDCSSLEPRDVLKYLLNTQLLIRDQDKSCGGNRKDSYFLWLPNWGIVLKTWNEARQQLLLLLAQRKEMSKVNVLQKNRNSRISTIFLINDLLSKEKIRVVERPFGSFVQVVKDS